MGSLAGKDGDRVRARGAAAVHVQRRPGIVLLLFRDAEGVLPGVRQRGLVGVPRRGAAQVPERQAHRAPHRGIGPVAVAEHAVARVEVERARDGPVDDHQGHAHVGGLAHPVEVVGGVERGGKDLIERLRQALARAFSIAAKWDVKVIPEPTRQ